MKKCNLDVFSYNYRNSDNTNTRNTSWVRVGKGLVRHFSWNSNTCTGKYQRDLFKHENCCIERSPATLYINQFVFFISLSDPLLQFPIYYKRINIKDDNLKPYSAMCKSYWRKWNHFFFIRNGFSWMRLLFSRILPSICVISSFNISSHF